MINIPKYMLLWIRTLQTSLPGWEPKMEWSLEHRSFRGKEGVWKDYDLSLSKDIPAVYS